MIMPYRRVPYRVSLTVGNKVCSIAHVHRNSCHHTLPNSPLHAPAEIIPMRARPTGSYCPHVGRLGSDRKHAALLLVGRMVVKVDVCSRKGRYKIIKAIYYGCV